MVISHHAAIAFLGAHHHPRPLIKHLMPSSTTNPPSGEHPIGAPGPATAATAAAAAAANTTRKLLKKQHPPSLALRSTANPKSSSPSGPGPPLLRRASNSVDVTEGGLPSPLPSTLQRNGHAANGSTSRSASSGLGRSNTMPRMTMRRTTSLEADQMLAPLPREKLRKLRRWILCLAVVNFDLDVGYVPNRQT